MPWHGTLRNVVWPKNGVVDLDIQLWSDHDIKFNEITFDSYVSLNALPLWSLTSSEISVMTNSTTSSKYFSEFASLPSEVALKLKIEMEKFLIVYSVLDDDLTFRIRGRLIDLTKHLELPAPKVEKLGSNSLNNVKAAIGQIVMGALRLRGIKRTSKDFKKIYYAMHSLVDISLRKIDPDKITAGMVYEKVEQIWSVIE